MARTTKGRAALIEPLASRRSGNSLADRVVMICAERDKLIEAYTERVNDWGNAGRLLREHLGSARKIYLTALTALDDAKTQTADALNRYEVHRKEHGC